MSNNDEMWRKEQTLTLSPIFCALKITLRILFTHSSLLGTESAVKCIVFAFVLNLIPFSPTGSQTIAYRRSTTPCGKYGSAEDWYHERTSFLRMNQCLIQRLVRWAFL